MLDLILRFYEIETGRILIDGQNIAAVSRASLRRQIAYVGDRLDNDVSATPGVCCS